MFPDRGLRAGGQPKSTAERLANAQYALRYPTSLPSPLLPTAPLICLPLALSPWNVTRCAWYRRAYAPVSTQAEKNLIAQLEGQGQPVSAIAAELNARTRAENVAPGQPRSFFYKYDRHIRTYIHERDQQIAADRATQNLDHQALRPSFINAPAAWPQHMQHNPTFGTGIVPLSLNIAHRTLGNTAPDPAPGPLAAPAPAPAPTVAPLSNVGPAAQPASSKTKLCRHCKSKGVLVPIRGHVQRGSRDGMNQQLWCPIQRVWCNDGAPVPAGLQSRGR